MQEPSVRWRCCETKMPIDTQAVSQRLMLPNKAWRSQAVCSKGRLQITHETQIVSAERFRTPVALQ